mmetsp:Transcript_3754/g.6405  ORF Transcript_3754/g.6405 Transcript_3754/m.6405 type:complete len:211 (-) Transcript_3754:676-1308(-)
MRAGTTSERQSMGKIFALYCQKLFHIVNQTIQKMEQNPQSYTFALQTLSQANYKYFVKDCLHDQLYLKGILEPLQGSLDQSRSHLISQVKLPLFDQILLLKQRFISNNFLKRQSEQQRILIISIFSDLSQAQLKLSRHPDPDPSSTQRINLHRLLALKGSANGESEEEEEVEGVPKLERTQSDSTLDQFVDQLQEFMTVKFVEGYLESLI